MDNPFKKIIVGAAMLGAVAANEGVSAQNTPNKKPLQEKEISVNLKTKWAKDIAQQVMFDSGRVETLHQAQEFERRALLPFTQHLGAMDGGAEEKANYSFEDYKYLAKEFQEIMKVFSAIEKKFKFERNSLWVPINRLLNYKSSKDGWDEMQKMKDYEEHPENIDKQ